MAPKGRVFLIRELNMHTRGGTRVFVASEPVQRVHCVIRQFGVAVCVDTLSHAADSGNKEEDKYHVRKERREEAPRGILLSASPRDPILQLALRIQWEPWHRQVCQCRECLGLLGALHHFPVLCHHTSQSPKTELIETQRIFKHRTLSLPLMCLHRRKRSAHCRGLIPISLMTSSCTLGPGRPPMFRSLRGSESNQCLFQNSASSTSRDAPRRPQRQSLMTHFFSKGAHRTIPPPRTAGATPLFRLPHSLDEYNS